MISINNVDAKVEYLRISITDRCNLRCIYCMPPEGIVSRPQKELLTFEEIVRLVRIFASLGINKVRLTGGEPLVRKGAINLLKTLVRIEGIDEVTLTTNGVLLSLYADQLKKAGLKRINISLDTLKEDKFRRITKSNIFQKVLEGIDVAKRCEFHPLKLNMVVMRGINDDEIIDFVKFSLSKGLILRFIEFMNVTPLWKEEYFISIEEVKKICERKFVLSRMEDFGHGPATYYRVEKDGILGFINTSESNCKRCNRLRLTSTGALKMCLYEIQGLCLKSLLRKGVCDEKIKYIIKKQIRLKKDIDYTSEEASQLYMSSIGG